MSPWLQCSGFCYNAAAVLHNYQQTLPLQVLPPGATLSLSNALGEVKVWEGLPAASYSSPCRVFSEIASWRERKLIFFSIFLWLFFVKQTIPSVRSRHVSEELIFAEFLAMNSLNHWRVVLTQFQFKCAGNEAEAVYFLQFCFLFLKLFK